jgi:glycosyltransferase involved in cell wall biosynthesis
MENLVSIIIPTFNRAKSLQRAIDSIFCQTYKNWELIIVDNSSNDNTESVVNKYKMQKIKFISVNNSGIIAHSRNIGIQNSKGRFVAFLDSDDWWESEKLENSVKSLIKKNTHLVYHNCYMTSHQSKVITKCRSLKVDLIMDLVINGNTLVTSSVVVSRESLLTVGGFEESLSTVGWEDYHLWLKLAKLPGQFKKLNGVLGNCWQGEDNFDSPNRILLNLVQIERYFIKEFSDRVEIGKIWWLSYTRGKAYLKTGNFIDAKKSLNKVFFNGSPYIYKLKSLYYRFFIAFSNRQ